MILLFIKKFKLFFYDFRMFFIFTNKLFFIDISYTNDLGRASEHSNFGVIKGHSGVF